MEAYKGSILYVATYTRKRGTEAEGVSKMGKVMEGPFGALVAMSDARSCVVVFPWVTICCRMATKAGSIPPC